MSLMASALSPRRGCGEGDKAERWFDELRHRSARHEGRRRLTQQRGYLGFEGTDQFALGITVRVPAVLAAPFADSEELLAGSRHGMPRNMQLAPPAERFLFQRRERHQRSPRR